MNALLSVPLTRRLHRVPVIPLLHGRLAERSWSWDWEDQWTREWWPQGITWAGERLLVSWYAKSGGSRVSVVDLKTGRYGHVVLLDPAGSPLKIHAGGLAWIDGWLYVAATAKGFWILHESDLSDGRAARSASDERRRDPVNWQATSLQRPEPPDGGPPLRWSFLDAVTTPGESRWSSSEELAQPSMVEVRAKRATKPTHLYAGEYGRSGKSTRLWRLPVLDGQPSGPVELLGSGPQGMQGVTATDDGLVVSTSHGPWLRGSLRTLSAGHRDPAQDEHEATDVADQSLSRPHNHRAPIGVEDLTRDGAGRLWTPSEHPGRRAIVQLSPSCSCPSSSTRPGRHR